MKSVEYIGHPVTQAFKGIPGLVMFGGLKGWFTQTRSKSFLPWY